ncbi:MAG: hypothetical protein KJ556_20790 [Gammaproteobacteria bacterium]|nr:hypothetical protein [Gammaproteobacteria bacterium]
MNDRTEVTKRIKSTLKKKTGKNWSVTGGRGTAYCWLTVQAPKNRRVAHKRNPDWNGHDSIPACIALTGKPPWIDYISDKPDENLYMNDEDRELLGRVFGMAYPAHHQGLQISPDNWDRYMNYIEA